MLTTDDFDWSAEAKELTANINQLKQHTVFSRGRDPMKGFMIKSTNTDRILLFKFCEEVRDNAGEVLYWSFVSAETNRLCVKLFSDED